MKTLHIIGPAHLRELKRFAELRAQMREQIKAQNFEGATNFSAESKKLALEICEDLAAKTKKP